MGVIQSLGETSDKAVDAGEQYYKKTQEYYKLKVFQQLTLTSSMLCKIILIGSIGLMSFVFFVVSGTIALAAVLKSAVIASFLIGIALLVLAILVFLLRSKIEKLVIKKLAKNFFK